MLKISSLLHQYFCKNSNKSYILLVYTICASYQYVTLKSYNLVKSNRSYVKLVENQSLKKLFTIVQSPR